MATDGPHLPPLCHKDDVIAFEELDEPCTIRDRSVGAHRDVADLKVGTRL